MARVCNNCGTKYDDNMMNCPNCGAPAPQMNQQPKGGQPQYQQPVQPQEPKAEFVNRNDGVQSSRLHVDDAYIPPFLRKYRDNK